MSFIPSCKCRRTHLSYTDFYGIINVSTHIVHSFNNLRKSIIAVLSFTNFYGNSAYIAPSFTGFYGNGQAHLQGESAVADLWTHFSRNVELSHAYLALFPSFQFSSVNEKQELNGCLISSKLTYSHKSDSVACLYTYG